jgi:hypothetical protein
MSCEGRHDLALLLRRHLERIEGSLELGGALVELLGRDPEVAMGLFQSATL